VNRYSIGRKQKVKELVMDYLHISVHQYTCEPDLS